MTAQPSPIEPERASPSMLLYSLLFALPYLGGALAIGSLYVRFVPNPQQNVLPTLGHVLAVCAAFVPSWVFAKRQRRLFSPHESRRLIAFCLCWVFLLEGVAVVSRPAVLSLPPLALTGIFAFAFVVDALVIWVSFRYVVRMLLAGTLPEEACEAAPTSVRIRPSSDRVAILAPLLVLLVIAGAIAFVKSRLLVPIQVTVADIPHVLRKVSTATRTPAVASFVFATAGRPSPKDAVNLQFSVENGRPGFNWVLLAPRNIEDETSFIAFIQRRGYTFSQRSRNGVDYLRIEDGDLALLCADVVTKFYFRPRSEAMDLVIEGFDWDE